MRSRPWHFLAVHLALLSSACVGTSTGNPVKPPDEIPTNEGGSDSCDRTITNLADLGAETPLGFSARDVLALAEANAETTLEWHTGVPVGPESGTSTLIVQVEPRDTPARFVDRRPKTGGNGRGDIEIATVGTLCEDQVEIDVHVHLATGGGALDEQFDAVLRAKGPNVARMYVSRKAADLTGSLEAQLPGQPTAKLESVQLEVAFSELGPSGSLNVGFIVPASGNSSTGSATQPPAVAHWPAGPRCDEGGFKASIDQKLDGFSLQDGIERFNAAQLQLSAPGSEATPLHATFSPTGRACALLEPSIFASSDPIPSISIDGQLTLKTDDGRIDGKWPVKLRAGAAADGSLGEVFAGFDLHGSMIASLVEAAVFETTYGMHGFDLSGYDQAGILLSLRVGPAAAASGEITVNGVKRPACQTQPAQPAPNSGSGIAAPSSPGCAGLQFTPLWTATVTAR
jgi:hypothetical protein